MRVGRMQGRRLDSRAPIFARGRDRAGQGNVPPHPAHLSCADMVTAVPVRHEAIGAFGAVHLTGRRTFPADS